MHFRVVPQEQAEKKLEGHSAYINHLRREYQNPDDFGSLNKIIQEADEMANESFAFSADDAFRYHIGDTITECLFDGDIRTAFMLCAMLGLPLPN